jgi:hypothetical protein
MKLLKLEKHDYSIMYVNDNETYMVYRRSGPDNWQIFRNNLWRDVTSYEQLEKLFKENDTTRKSN